jgi:Restriction endonuclease
MDDPKWKRFEKLVYGLQKELAGEAEVRMNDSIKGVDSKVDRQIDIAIRRRVGQYPILIVIDCKDYAEPLDVKDVESFSGMVKDVRANRGALITSSSFTKAALNLAQNHGIDTFRLVDTETVDWKSLAAIPCLLDRTYIHGFMYRFGAVGAEHIKIPVSPDEQSRLEFYSVDGAKQGTLRAMVERKWDKAEMPREQGDHVVQLGQHLITRFRDIESHQKIDAIVRVNRTFYFGPLPVKLRGLQNMQTGGVITRAVTTDFIEFHKIATGQDKNWKQIDDPSQLAVLKPAITLGYCDVYSDDAVPDKPKAAKSDASF